MSNTNQPTGQQLTAEEFQNVAYNLSIDYFREIYSFDQFKGKFQSYLSQYAAQQTAAVQKKLTVAISLLQGFPIAEPGDFSIGGKHHEWYCSRCDFLENNGVLGTGVIKQTNEKDALREELERAKGRIDFYREAADIKEITIQEMDVRISEMQKERDGWEHNATTVSKGYHRLDKELNEVKFENEQLKADLEEAAKQIKGWKAHCERETKPASPWISVEDRLPAEGYWLVWLKGTEKAYYHADKKVFKDDNHQQVFPRYYTDLLPAPPESLTDKTE